VFPVLFGIPAAERATAAWVVLLMGLSVAISMPLTTAGAVLRGLQRHDLVNMVTVAGTLLSAVGIVTTLLLGGGLREIVVVNVVMTVAAQASSAWLVRRIAPDFGLRWRGARRDLLRSIYHFTLPVFLTNLGGHLQFKTDGLIVGSLLSLEAVTPYSIALKMGEIPQILTDQFMRVLLPLSSHLHAKGDTEKLKSLFTTSTRLSLAIASSVTCTLILVSDLVLSSWVGSDYAEYGYLVAILSLALLIDTTSWPAGLILQGMGRHRPLAIMSIGSGIANLLLSIILVERFGLAGVALGTLIPTTIEILLFVMPYAARELGLRASTVLNEIVLPALFPVAPLAVAVGLIRYVFEPESLVALVVVAGGGMIVYLVVYLAASAREFERELMHAAAAAVLRAAGKQRALLP
jgi:O-antigen/teichoic acid export membrane protein